MKEGLVLIEVFYSIWIFTKDATDNSKIIIKDMVYVLMKEVNLVIQ